MDPTEDMHFYEPAHGQGLARDPFNSIVAPRPIGWISTHVDAGDYFAIWPEALFQMTRPR